jgi:hypothetical protein
MIMENKAQVYGEKGMDRQKEIDGKSTYIVRKLQVFSVPIFVRLMIS